MTSVKELTSNFTKLETFVGVDFRRWQKKMKILLITLNVAYVISTPRPKESKNETLEQARKRTKWDNDDFICRGHILNGMNDSLFDVYQYHDSSKLLWEALEEKYMAEDASSKKFLVSYFNAYKMVDNCPIVDQFHDLQRLHSNMQIHDIKIDEIFVVSSIIDKLPPTWRDVRHALKHKKDDMSFADLGQHLVVESSF